jgi:aminoglycoside 6'-N-acetyltransferase
MSVLVLRPATRADIPLLDYWDSKPHVIEASGGDLEIDWKYELSQLGDWGEWLIAELDGRPIGMMQIIDPEREPEHYWDKAEGNLRAIDIWIGEESDLGKGYGTEMMRLAIERCFAEPNVTAILIDPMAANTRAHRFYERLGFRRIARRMFGNDDCYVYRLERADWRG